MILVTGASGKLGSLILADLRASGATAEGSSRGTGAGLRHVDFDAPASLRFEGVATLVLVSAGYAEDDQVVARHAAAVEGARRDGVGHVIYTSLIGAGDHLGFALAHRATERLIQDSGLHWTILRNGLYAELFGGLLAWNEGVLESAFGGGALSAVTRADLAAAAAAIAVCPDAHRGRTYELVGTPIGAAAVASRIEVPTDRSEWASTARACSVRGTCWRSSRRCWCRSPARSATASWTTSARTLSA